jgi:two-component system, NarL family, nitrate/nitrite response regulator NarL
MAHRIRVAVIDHHPLFRTGIVQALRRLGKFTVVGEGKQSSEISRLLIEKKPEVILLDIGGPGDAVSDLATITRDYPGVKVVILTALDDEEHVFQAIDAGARGYLLKGVSSAELARTIEAVHGGGHYLGPELAWRLLVEHKTQPSNPTPESAQKPDLTARELQLLSHTAEGLTNLEIAGKLGISFRTVKYYKTQLFRKLRARNRIEAMMIAKSKEMI